MRVVFWFCGLAVGVALILVGFLVLDPHETVYTGTYSSATSNITRVREALKDPSVRVIEYKECNFGSMEEVKFKVIQADSECPFPLGVGESSWSRTQTVCLVVGGLVLIGCFLEATVRE